LYFKNANLITERSPIMVAVILLAGLTGIGAIPPKWELLVARADELASQNQHTKAEEKYAEALKEAESFGRDDLPAAIVLDHNAFHDQQLGHLREAKRRYEHAFDSLARKTPNGPRLLEVVVGLSSVYLESGEISRAQSLLQRFLSRDVSYSLQDQAMLLANLGSALTAQGYLRQGEVRFDEVLKILENDGTERQLIVKTLNNLASIDCATGRVSNALEYSQKARRILLEIQSPPPDLVIKTLTNAGATTLLDRKYEESRRLYAQALALCEETFGSGHYLLVPILQGYSQALPRLNLKAEAKRANKRAAIILDRFRHENGLGLTIDVRALSGTHSKGGNIWLQ
jgi:tetratricopeptide (TPR) repeat protein